MNRSQKQEEIEYLGETIGQLAHAFLVDFTGLNVARSTDLRTQLRENDGVMRIVKNRLAKRAFADTALGQAESAFVGQTAIVYPNGEDAVAIAKVLRDFNKEHDIGGVKIGLVDGQLITPEEFQSFADLPSRDELIAKVVYLMQHPITGLATALNSILRNFVVVLDAVRQQQENELADRPSGVAE